MSLLAHYVRVTEEMPCPVCGRPDWCLCHRDGHKAICTRVPSGRRYGDAGFCHYLPSHDVRPAIVALPAPKKYLTPAQVRRFLDSVYCSPDDELFRKQAQAVKLSARSLAMMQAGYDPRPAVLTFPMFDAAGNPTGCRFRRRDGKKWSLKGGREGVFLSRAFDPRCPVWIAEGPTDSAALIEAGFDNVLGRPNCSGGTAIIRDLLAVRRRTPVVVLADPDEPGIAGAERLVLSIPNPAIVLTGVHDVRDFVTRFRERHKAAEAIIEVLTACRPGVVRVVSRNLAGQLFDFSQIRIGDHHVKQAVGRPA